VAPETAEGNLEIVFEHGRAFDWFCREGAAVN